MTDDERGDLIRTAFGRDVADADRERALRLLGREVGVGTDAGGVQPGAAEGEEDTLDADALDDIEPRASGRKRAVVVVAALAGLAAGVTLQWWITGGMLGSFSSRGDRVAEAGGWAAESGMDRDSFLYVGEAASTRLWFATRGSGREACLVVKPIASSSLPPSTACHPSSGTNADVVSLSWSTADRHGDVARQTITVTVSSAEVELVSVITTA